MQNLFTSGSRCIKIFNTNSLQGCLNPFRYLKGLCDVYKGNLMMKALQACYSCFTAVLANDTYVVEIISCNTKYYMASKHCTAPLNFQDPLLYGTIPFLK